MKTITAVLLAGGLADAVSLCTRLRGAPDGDEVTSSGVWRTSS